PAHFLGDALQPRRAHLAGRSDGESIAGDEERLAPMHALAEVGHEIPERSRLPALGERVEALGHTIGPGRDLIGIDRVELFLLPGHFQVPEDQRLPADDRVRGRASARGGRPDRVERGVRLESGGLRTVHLLLIVARAASVAERWYHVGTPEGIAWPNPSRSRSPSRSSRPSVPNRSLRAIRPRRPSRTTYASRCSRSTRHSSRSRSNASGSSITRCASPITATRR